MAKISLSEGFSLIPEGTQVFKITEVIYKEEFGKLEITMITAKGQKHTERFNLVSANGSPCEGAINAFSFFAKTALGDYELTEIDHDDLVGHYIKCEITHEEVPSNKDPNKTVKFVRLTNKYPADGFEEAATSTPPKASSSAPAATASAASKVTPKKIDLDDLLG